MYTITTTLRVCTAPGCTRLINADSRNITTCAKHYGRPSEGTPRPCAVPGCPRLVPAHYNPRVQYCYECHKLYDDTRRCPGCGVAIFAEHRTCQGCGPALLGVPHG